MFCAGSLGDPCVGVNRASTQNYTEADVSSHPVDNLSYTFNGFNLNSSIAPLNKFSKKCHQTDLKKKRRENT